MNGNIYKSAGMAVGIVVGLILAVALVLIANNNRKVRTEYDERQLRVRGDAYRYAFYTVVIWEAVLLVLAVGEFNLPVPAYVLHFAGVIAGLAVLTSFCIWKDAYWGLNNNRRRYGIILVAAGLLNAIPIFGSMAGRESSDFPYVNTLVCVMLLAIGVELLLKQLQEKREERDGESA